MSMVTVSADVSKQMIQWADEKVKKGLYKSRSEVVRELFREKMLLDEDFLVSHKVLEEVWKDEDDNYWEKFLEK